MPYVTLKDPKVEDTVKKNVDEIVQNSDRRFVVTVAGGAPHNEAPDSQF